MTNWIYGKHQINSAIKNKIKIDKLYCTPKSFDIIELCKKHRINYKLRKSEEISKIVRNHNHQNVIALVFTKPLIVLDDYLKNTKSKDLIIILDKIQDPQNFGSIIRSCVAYNVGAIIFGKHNQAPITPTVVKTSTGTIDQINMVQVTNLSLAIQKLKKEGYWIYATSIGEDAKNLKTIDLNPKKAIILGNEGSGISAQLIKNSDYKIKIEMIGELNSLNVSVACGIILYTINSLEEII